MERVGRSDINRVDAGVRSEFIGICVNTFDVEPLRELARFFECAANGGTGAAAEVFSIVIAPAAFALTLVPGFVAITIAFATPFVIAIAFPGAADFFARKLPRTVRRLTSETAANFVLRTHEHPQGELAADVPTLIVAADGRQQVFGSGGRVDPSHPLIVFSEFQRVSQAGAIDAVDLLADFRADYAADHRPQHGGNSFPGAPTDLRAERSTRDGAGGGTQRGPDRFAVASAVDDPVVGVPLPAGLAGVTAVVLAAPAMGRCPRRRVRVAR